MDLNSIMDQVKMIAKNASQLMKERFSVKEKGNASNLVTSADLNVQHYLMDKLPPLVADSGFYGEEDDLQASDKEWCWIVDPIDGTANFARGLKQSCISIALRHFEDLVLGFVYNPDSEEMFYAIKGQGAFLNGQPLHVADTDFKHSIVFTALCQYERKYSQVCDKILNDVFDECSDFRRFGSAALELCYLAAGRADMYFEIRLCPWDFSAATVILREAGGIIGTIGTEKLVLDRKSPIVAANNRENYDKLCAIIDRHLKEDPFRV